MCLTLDSYPVACSNCNFDKMCRKASQSKQTKRLHKKICPATGRTERSECWEQAKREREQFTSIKSVKGGKKIDVSHKGTEYLKQPPKEASISIHVEGIERQEILRKDLLTEKEVTKRLLLGRPDQSKGDMVRGGSDGHFQFKTSNGGGGGKGRTRVRGSAQKEAGSVHF